MSLLLDARKKSLQTQAAQGGEGSHDGIKLSLEELPSTASTKNIPTPENKARNIGKNLFNANSPSSGLARMAGMNRNVLLALGGTILLIALGIGYLWYINSAVSNNQSLLTRAPAPSKASPQNNLAVEPPTPASAGNVFQAQILSGVPHEKKRASRQSGAHIRIKPQQAEPLDPLLNNAYGAYRGGRLSEAQQMYLEVLDKDTRNTDALLGLAAISQLQGEDGFAMQYYLRVLTQDPRNAVANAGMSALNMDENSESRLKNLLREQRDSAALHFALGNLYADQSRWGEAQSAYFNAYTLDSKNAELAFNLAVSLDHLGQNKMAAQYYQRVLDLGGERTHDFNPTQISQRIKELTR
ncbi:MAG: tetratricopeptide repeat protein [Gallionella sp.]